MVGRDLMPVIYVDKKAVTVDSLRGWLPDLSPYHRVAVDTETSGLYVDGDWQDAPKARISMVSIGWYCDGTAVDGGQCTRLNEHRHTLAMPFDQGRVGGKPGKWDKVAHGYETIPHTLECNRHNAQTLERSDGFAIDKCVCAPWNLSVEDFIHLCGWLVDRPLVMHHKKFDCHMFAAGLRNHPNTGVDLMSYVVADTMLRIGVIRPLSSSSLKPTTSRLFPGEHTTDDQDHVKKALSKNGVGLTYRYDLLALEDIGPYAGEDADMTIHLDAYELELLEMGDIDPIDWKIIEQEEALSELLYKMERRGIGLDRAGMREAARQMELEAARVAESLPFKPANVNAAKEWFYETLNLVPIKTTPTCRHCGLNMETGKSRKKNLDASCSHERSPSLDTEVAARLAQEGHRGAREWQHLANIKSALSKWYRAWPELCGDDGRIRTVFRQGRIESDRKGQTSGGAISGRLSTERVQTQGVPDDYRIPEGIKPVKKLFTAKEGYGLFELDLSNAEVRVAAWLLQSPTLRDACMSSNVHSYNCVMMFGDYLWSTFPMDILPAAKEALTVEQEIEILEKHHPEWGKYRKVAKTTILGQFFGAGVRTLKAQVEQATKQDYKESKIREFMEATLKVVPELKATSRAMQRKADKALGGCGYIRLVNGRRRWFGWQEHTYKAFNSGTQGGVAEVMKEYMLMVEAKYPGLLVNQVHDSMWLEVPLDEAESIIPDIQKMGEDLFEVRFSTEYLRVPFKVDRKRLA